MSSAEANLIVAKAFLKALEEGRPQEAKAYFADDILQIEYPNRIKPNGDRRGAAAMAADGQKGLQVLRRQTFEIKNAIALGDRVSLEVLWTGILAVPMGALKGGDAMTCFSGIFLDFRNGKIVGQRNYDCFPPF